jgi:hypothetical protein
VLDSTGKTLEKTEEEERLKQDINTYILESYKAQGSKIVKELNTKLLKSIPDSSDRKEAYVKIKSSLELRKKRIENLKMSDTKKMILEEFLTHMIDLLYKQIEDIK